MRFEYIKMILNYNNTPIYYEIQGKGPALVLLHGFLESITMWEPLIPKTIENKTVITIDLPGHGKSGCIGKVHSMELMAEVVHYILKYHTIKSATFMGHSMGGYVALAYAEMYDAEVNTLILLNSTPAEDSADRKRNRDRLLKVISSNPNAFIEMAIRNLFTEETQEKYASEIQKMKNEALKFPIEGIIATIKGMKNRKDRTLILKKFSKEKYMICGIHDPIIPFKDSETLATLSGSELIKVNGGHMSLIENYDEIENFNKVKA